MKHEKQQQELKAFLKKYEHELTNQVKEDEVSIKAKILTENDIDEAAKQIINGELVAFPTETVYGLGANAYDPEALKKIYQVKKRPLTDPIIVHVLDSEQALKLVIATNEERKLFDLLTKKFWPGPLTVILKANLDLLPLIVTAQTGFVGIRSPKHPYARKLIEHSQLPIGAPSANLFSHVSPTKPVHVFNDFYKDQISIVDGERCEYGVQSTVIKIHNNELHVLREGSFSIEKLQYFLKNSLDHQELPEVFVHKKTESKHTNMQAPGQLLKHYAPYLPCYYLTPKNNLTTIFQVKLATEEQPQTIYLKDIALISFSESKFSKYKLSAKYYFQVGEESKLEKNMSIDEESDEDIFCEKEEKQKMKEIYHLLRKCENLDSKAILIGWADDKKGTLWDKIFRSTQGQEAIPVQ